MKVSLGKNDYNVKEVTSEEDKKKGLQGVKELPKDEGMLFVYDPPQEVTMWMKDTLIPLDIIFINDDQEVIKVAKGEPNDTSKITVDNVNYVLELNIDSGVKKGDVLEFEDDSPIMKVLAQDGSTQMDLWGGERIISRAETKVIIRKAKKADASKSDNDYKTLGRYIFKVIKGQDSRDAEYVSK